MGVWVLQNLPRMSHILADVAVSSSSQVPLRVEAIKRLPESSSLLEGLATGLGHHVEVRIAAVNRLPYRSFIKRWHVPKSRVNEASSRLLTDSPALLYLAEEDSSVEVKSAARKRIRENRAYLGAGSFII